ncbi:MAG: GNAT family N-acetyltransferase [Chlamydiales bacterium]|nr:GNAT family N-acetyltransferase [Chlamydiales bacterium]
MKVFIALLLSLSTLFAYNLQDRDIDSFHFEWDHTEDYSQAGNMFIESFMVAYHPFSKEELGVEDTRIFLTETINEELDLVTQQPENIHWLIAKEGTKVIGLLILDLTEFPDQVYGRQMAIDPSYFHQKVGTQMAQVAREALPEIKKFTAITRVMNGTSMKFFESLGLKKSSFMHEDYDSNKYVGFELTND